MLTKLGKFVTILSLGFLLGMELQGEEVGGGQIMDSTMPTESQMEGITTFFRDCFHVEKLSKVQVRGEAEAEFGMPLRRLKAGVVTGSDLGTVEIELTPDDGTVVWYMALSLHEKPAPELTLKDAFPEDKAWERALPILTHYGLPTDRSEYKIELEDLGTLNGKNDLYGAWWAISRDLTHKGMACPPSRIRVSVSAFSGAIESVLYVPVVVPHARQELVSRTEALEKAREWLKHKKCFESMTLTVGDTDKAQTAEVIARPMDILSEDEEESYPDTGDAYYCWEVPYRFIEHGHERTHFVWVRIDNGEVIGSR